MLVKVLHKIHDHEKLVSEVLDLISSTRPEKNQISCQTTEENIGDWFESIGSIDDLPEKEEIKYSCIHPDLKGTAIEKQILRYKGFRSRIMIMGPRKCYSVHKDPTPRIHIPIITNDQSWMVWPKDNLCYNLRPGVSYWTDTRKLHSFFNGDGENNRIHLVINITNDSNYT